MATKLTNQDTEPEPPTDRSYGMVSLRYAPLTSASPSNPASSQPNTSTAATNLQVLLICQKTPNCGPPFWTFPKGHPEPGDATLLDTARRELFEETGIVVGLEDVLCFPSSDTEKDVKGEVAAKELTFQERYRIPYKPKNSDATSPQQPTNSTFQEPYTSPNRTRGKVVTYYVAFLPSTTSTTLELQEKEVAAAKWMSLDEAMATIQFPEGKEVLRGVREAIEKAGGMEGCGRMSSNDGIGVGGVKEGKL